MHDTSSLAEAIVEQIADAVIFADATGSIRRWNRAAATLFGYSAAEALGQKLDLTIPEHLRAVHWRGFEAAMTDGVTKLQSRPTLTPCHAPDRTQTLRRNDLRPRQGTGRRHSARRRRRRSRRDRAHRTATGG